MYWRTLRLILQFHVAELLTVWPTTIHGPARAILQTMLFVNRMGHGCSTTTGCSELAELLHTTQLRFYNLFAKRSLGITLQIVELL